ncbi:baculoviral IAP repeat-containing protein 3-like isoform X2 [Ruditapes philippinarum]|uniref:baculoviral IAP repeat-containing protein 3-like isoform X2 n=1 Tax=Ruditapes philippinarum TaxID=129788 RepID=UPI00295C1762|nr:baculoviral IAP repeat-containing protein 3-like isoform X2 [Ruditapes philippinarum]
MDEYFKRCASEQPFKDNEDKKFEFRRLLSFQNWPQECPVFPIKLAKAGFYYNNNGDEVKCFRCGTVKSDWQAEDDPNEIHRLLNPDCPYLTGNESEVNVPISKPDSDHEDSSLIRRLNSVIEERREAVENETEIAVENEADNVTEARSQEDQSEPDERSSESPEANVSRSRSLGTLQDSTVSGLKSSSLPESRSSSTIDTAPRGNENLADSAMMLDNSAGVLHDTGRSKNESKSKSDKKKEKQLKKQKEKKDKKFFKGTKGSSSSKRGSESNVTPQRGYDIPPPTGEGIGPLRFERNRLETFNTWPSNACVPAAELAKSGFYYTGSGDRVQCIFCKGVLRNWEEGDRPHIEHRKHFPRCPIVLGMKMGNVPLPLDQSPTSTSAGSTQGAAGLNAGTNVADSLGNMENLGIVTDRPKNQHYAIESQRLLSFQGWPPYKHQTPQLLAEAGFWYAGFNDNVKCFYCDGGLRNWETGDEPWEEHARWFPKCPFVVQVKGQEFINNVLREKGVELPASIQTVAPANREQQSTGKYRIEEREIRARMDSPNIRKVLELGFSRDVVMNTLRKRLRETGDDFPSITTLMEAIYKEEAEETRRQSQNPPQSQNNAPSQNATQSKNSSQSSAITGSENVSDQTGSNDIIEEIAGMTDLTVNQSEINKDKGKQDPGTSKKKPDVKGSSKNDIADDMSGKSSPHVHAQADDLMKENIELKEQRLCKICMVSDANVVFLPCGHLVSCATCAPALQQCPICRASIKGTVRTYIA